MLLFEQLLGVYKLSKSQTCIDGVRVARLDNRVIFGYNMPDGHITNIERAGQGADVKFLFEGYPGTCHVDFTAKNLYRPSVVGNNVNFPYVSGYDARGNRIAKDFMISRHKIFNMRHHLLGLENPGVGFRSIFVNLEMELSDNLSDETLRSIKFNADEVKRELEGGLTDTEKTQFMLFVEYGYNYSTPSVPKKT